MITSLPGPVVTIGLLLLSNIFMTFAWYGHLKFTDTPLLTVIGVSWGIALLEYCFQVPANRIGHNSFSAAQLKTIQEVITLNPRITAAVKIAVSRKVPPLLAKLRMRDVPDCAEEAPNK